MFMLGFERGVRKVIDKLNHFLHLAIGVAVEVLKNNQLEEPALLKREVPTDYFLEILMLRNEACRILFNLSITLHYL